MIVHNLCTLYSGINPLLVENEPFHDIITLYSDVRRMQIRENRGQDPKGNKVVRRRASDDAGWW